MSYIVNSTGYIDPPVNLYETDLEDLKNIYRIKIITYFVTNNNAKEYYDIEKGISYTPLNYVYTPEEITEIICFQINENKLLSTLPLFIYLTYKTNNWTEKIEIENEIQNYINDFNSFFSKELDTSIFYGLNKFIEDNWNNYQNSDQQQQPPGASPESSLLDKFKFFWKNDCRHNFSFPSREINLPEVKTLTKEEFFKEV